MAGTVFDEAELRDAQATDWLTRARQGVNQFMTETVAPAAQQVQQMASSAASTVADAVPDMQGFELPSFESLATRPMTAMCATICKTTSVSWPCALWLPACRAA